MTIKRQQAISKVKAKLIGRLVNRVEVQKRINQRLKKKLEEQKKRNVDMHRTYRRVIRNLRRRGQLGGE